MKPLAHIGIIDKTITYRDRPTVKVVVKKGDTVLILNKGLLPGGGIDEGESEREAIDRELMEELGITVRDVEKIGTVIQHRNFIGKRYVVHAYTATLHSEGGATDPQDEGEAHFNLEWLTVDEALALAVNSSREAALKPMIDDVNQGKYYNFMTTRWILNKLQSKPHPTAS